MCDSCCQGLLQIPEKGKHALVFLLSRLCWNFRMLQNETGWSWKQLCICSSWSCQTTNTNAIEVMDLDRWEHKSAGIAIFMFSMVVLSRHLSESSKGFDSPNTSSPAETKEIQECTIHLLNFKVSIHQNTNLISKSQTFDKFWQN